MVFLLCAAALLLRYRSTEAAGMYTDTQNIWGNNYYAYPVKCHTIARENGTVMLVYSVLNEKKQQTLVIDLIDSAGKCTHYKKLSIPGETWGGTVYQAPDGCNYITTGNSGNIAFFVMKYSADWTLLGTTSITKYESYTNIAFDAGNSDMAMAGDYLIVHTARLRKDGHQSNFTSWIDTKTMEAVSIADKFPATHVSHSFSQFVRYDGKHIIMIDHGDGYPRGISMITELPDLNNKGTEESLLMKFWGKVGANNTGATVDGFELGSKHHLVVGSSIPHDRFTSEAEYAAYLGGDDLETDYSYLYTYTRDLYVVLIDPISGLPQFKWLTNYPPSSWIENVEMIKLTEDKFILLYGTCKATETSDYNYDKSYYTNYMLIDSEGNIKKTGEMDKKLYCTSEPSYYDGILTWCCYEESELGCFMALNRWNIETGAFTVQNIDTGFASKISTILRTDDQKEYKSGENFEITLKVFSEIFNDSSVVALTAPAVWRSSNDSVIQVLEKETMLDTGISWNSVDMKNRLHLLCCYA